MVGRINPNVASLTPYKPGKPVDELTRELGLTDIVKLASNENPRGPGEQVQQAIRDASRALSRYPDGNGYALKQALALELGVDSSQITLGNGSNDCLELAARMAITAESQAVIAEHAFVVYTLAVTACGGTLVRVPALKFGADLDAMRSAISERTAMVFLANPNNPTGTWVGEDALVQFLDALPEHVWMVLDEAYFEYVEADSYPDGIRLLERYPNLIVTRTFSKIYGLAALRVGYAVSSPYVAELLNRARQPFNVNALALAGAEAALQDSAYVEQSRRLNASGMVQVTQGLTALGLNFIPSLGNFLSFAVPESAAALDVYNALLREGVIVRPIAEYGLPGHLRATIGLPEENARFLEALGRVLS